ncbi:hypothetical protein HEP87_63060 [Streptomyces sp. S1D4-11]|nr:hypothetical protein [Streptomyces sp. S1D4-11]
MERLVDRGEGDVDDEVVGLRHEHADEQNHDPGRTQVAGAVVAGRATHQKVVLGGLGVDAAVDDGAHGVDDRQEGT